MGYSPLPLHPVELGEAHVGYSPLPLHPVELPVEPELRHSHT